jgi:DNA-binding NarL/FixJ family response regulator
MKKIRVFVADDSPFICERIIELLSQMSNIEIIGQAGNGIEAQSLILELYPDVAVIDIQMPGKNGIKVLRYLKKIIPCIKVIMITNHPFSVYKKACKEEGADFFIDKSENLNVITDVLKQWKYKPNNTINKNLCVF